MIYFDTSVLVALLTNEASAPAIRDWYVRNSAKVLVTSDWAVTEFSSAIALKVRTQQITTRQAKMVLGTFNDFVDGGIRLLAISRQAFHDAAERIQEMSGLRAGDALHLCVATDAGVKEFATLDNLLAAKAVELKMTLTDFNRA